MAVFAIAGSAVVPLQNSVASAATSTPKLATPLQIISQINSMRHAFGLVAGTSTTKFNALVRAAALGQRDPILPSLTGGAVTEYGLWGLSPQSPPVSTATTAAVINAWVYHDGWKGTNTWNLDCVSPSSPNCNGHRRAVLSSPPQRGDQLSIDVTALPATWQGDPSVSLAILMIWTPKSTTAK